MDKLILNMSFDWNIENNEWERNYAIFNYYNDLNNVNLLLSNNNIIIYPNPANNVITLKISGDQKPLTFEVIDQAARVVMEGVLSHETSNIDISHLSPGYYSVRLSGQKEPNIPFLKL